jgi:hypothetical protein
LINSDSWIGSLESTDKPPGSAHSCALFVGSGNADRRFEGAET